MKTIEEFCDHHLACSEGKQWAIANCQTMQDAWDAAQHDWLLWIATRQGVASDNQLRKFAVWCARQVQHLMKDQRSLDALDFSERHSDGLATDEEMAAARAAARAAASAAASAAARAAAWDAAWDAARAAARAAASAAAGDAAGAAARAAARAAAWAAAGDAAGAAAWDAARAAAWAAASAAARVAAWAAAGDAASAAQDEWLRTNIIPSFN